MLGPHCNLLAQRAAIDLACAAGRKFPAEVIDIRPLESFDSVGDPGTQFSSSIFAFVARHDERVDALAHHRVGHADGQRRCHRRMLDEDRSSSSGEILAPPHV